MIFTFEWSKRCDSVLHKNEAVIHHSVTGSALNETFNQKRYNTIQHKAMSHKSLAVSDWHSPSIRLNAPKKFFAD